MKKLFFLFFLVEILTCYSTFSMELWQSLLSEFNEVSAIDSLNVFVCGDDGRLIHTSNGGENWNFVETGSRSNFNSIYFLDLHSGCIAADGGMCLTTTDGGQNWRINNVVAGNFCSIMMLNSQIIMAVDSSGKIYRSTDYGQNWFVQFEDTSMKFTSINSHDGTFTLCGGIGRFLYESKDSGITWNSVLTLDKISYSSRFSNCGTELMVFVQDTSLSTSFIIKSSNNGNSWTSSDTGNFYHANLKFFNSSYIILVSMYKIFRSYDFGKNWLIEDFGLQNMYSLNFVNQWYLMPKNISITKDGQIFITGNQDFIAMARSFINQFKIISFSGIESEVIYEINNVLSTSKTTIYALGPNQGITKSNDAGLTWQHLFPLVKDGDMSAIYDTLVIPSSWINSIIFTDSLNGIIYGTNTHNSQYNTGFNLISSDGGINWHTRPSVCLSQVIFIDTETGVGIKDSSCYKTTNGGQKWIKNDYSFSGRLLNKINFLSMKTGYLSAFNAYPITTDDTVHFPKKQKGYFELYNTEDSANTWQKILSFDTYLYNFHSGCYMINQDTGIIFGACLSGSLFITHNKWKSFDTIKLDAYPNFNDMLFIDAINGLAAGNNDTIFITVDGGYSWNPMKINISNKKGFFSFYPLNYFFGKFDHLQRLDDCSVLAYGYRRLVKLNICDIITSVNNSQNQMMNPEKFKINIYPMPADDKINLIIKCISKDFTNI